MCKLKFLVLVIWFTIVATYGYTQQTPNFIVIFVDDMGYGDAGCYGHPTIKTPQLDQMAEEGIRMTQFYVASPVCSPSRASLLTGRLPVRCGVTGVLFPRHDKGLPQSEKTIATLLKEKKYATACVGKWHLGHKPGYLPTNHGFDSYYGIPYSNDMYIDSMAELANDVVLREGVTVEKIRNNEYYRHRPKYVPLMRQEKVIEFPADQATLTKRYTKESIKFIKSHKNEPFFLYLAHTMPHTPLYVTDEFKNKSLRGLYGDVIEELDWSVGEILKTLKEEGLDENTMVVFTSDNGPWLQQKLNGGSSGLLRGGKFSTWEGGMREPCIFWWPGQIPSGKVSTKTASTLDLLPTLLDLSDIRLPTNVTYDGYSLVDMLLNDSDSPREEMFFYKGRKLQAVRQGVWKAHFITSADDGKNTIPLESPVLFNLEIDPSEKYDVAKDNPEILVKIQKLKLNHEGSFK